MLIGKVIEVSSGSRWKDGREHVVLDVRDESNQNVGELRLPNEELLVLDEQVEIKLRVLEPIE